MTPNGSSTRTTCNATWASSSTSSALTARRPAPFFKDQPSIEGSGVFLHLNTSKRSVTLDLKRDAGREACLRLVRKADIVIENFAPRVMPSLKLDYDVLKGVNPHLVMTS